MKKLIVGIIAAALMSLGLVGFTTTSAQACAPGYEGSCVKTKSHTKAPKKVKKGKKVKVKVKIKTPGNVTPEGAVVVKCTNGKAKKTKVRAVSGSSRNVQMGKFNKKGTWKCVSKFRGVNTKNSTSKFTIKVK